MQHTRWILAGAMSAALCLADAGLARQTGAPTHHDVTVDVDSGWVRGAGGASGVLHRRTVEVQGAAWLRLRFATAVLGDPAGGDEPTRLRLVSRDDGAEQWLDAAALVRWSHTSAYFNGDAVVVEIIGDGDAGPSRITVDSVMAGFAAGGVATICGEEDDRVLAADPRAARLLPAGCTAWMIDDEQHCFLSAGHCGLGASSVVQFNVPMSERDGTLRHPPPEDQYAVDLLSVRAASTGVGNDWAYFGCHPNDNTGMTPFVAQGDSFELAPPPESAGGMARVTGYGADDSPPEWDQVQQTHAGPLTQVANAVLYYQADTRSGNSGSPVIDEATGRAIGIHTNGGCNAADGANRGTSLDSPELVNALASPLGVCQPTPAVTFAFPEGLPDPVAPTGTTVLVELTGSEKGQPVPGTELVHVDVGGGFVATAMTPLGPTGFAAVLPPQPCGTLVRYYFSVESTDGGTAESPAAGAEAPYVTVAAVAYDFVFTDDFQTDAGWTVVNDPGLLHGAWERGVPEGGGDRGDPAFDADGAGLCMVTGLADGNNDVDGGWTALVSPRLDASQGDAHLSYSRWFSNSAGAAPFEDVMLVELSSDDGATWTAIDTVGPTGPDVNGGWVERSLRVGDHIEPTSGLRVRFTVSDVGKPSIVEAGVDRVILSRSADGLICTACPADVNVDGIVDADDAVAVLLAWGPCPAACPADVTADGAVDVDDLLDVLLSWGPCTGP
ncbi:MAG: trypsin-like peptidase domain-containing protein [Planctomycetota bacterium]|jgi:hypothetical protein